MKQVQYFFLIWLIFNLLTLNQVFARDLKGFELSGEIRLRSEFDDRDFDASTSFYSYNLLRTRLNIKKNLPDKSFVVIQLQDSRIYGTEGSSPESGTRLSVGNVDLHQGYVRFETVGFPWLAFQFGRMELCYGNQRLLSGNNWSNAGRSFDAVLSTITLKKATVDLFAASLYESRASAHKSPPEDDGDVALYGVWIKLNPQKFGNLDVYILHDRDFEENGSGESKMLRSTGGALFHGKSKGFNWSLETNYQFGKTGFTTDISAYYIIALAGYAWDSKCKPGLSLGYDFLSGDDPDTEFYETFNTLYPSRHRYFGYMDYIRNIPGDVQDRGVNDIQIRAFLSPVKNLNLNMNIHFFKLAQKTVIANNKTANRLGNEVDFVCKYKIQKNVKFEGGVSVFQPDDVFKAWKGNDLSFWVYGQLVAGF